MPTESRLEHDLYGDHGLDKPQAYQIIALDTISKLYQHCGFKMTAYPISSEIKRKSKSRLHTTGECCKVSEQQTVE